MHVTSVRRALPRAWTQVRSVPVASVRAWTVWQLPRRLALFVIAVTAVNLAGIGLAASSFSFREHQLLLFCVLLACDAATVELTRRTGEPAGVIKDVYAVWELPVAILLAPLYVMVIPVVRLALVQWRIRRAPLHRRVFSSAVLGLAFGGASLTFHFLTRHAVSAVPIPGPKASLWIAAVAACAVLEWAVNNALVFTVVRGGDPTTRLRTMAFSREPLFNDITELCVAVLVAFGAASTPLAVVVAFPFVLLLQRSVRHRQLVNDSRIDSKTGLLNAGTWEREALAEVARASRTRNPLAVALVDIDHFKAVNDTHGHLLGDQVLQGIARCFRDYLRDYDVAGRFGGEEFSLLLPHTSVEDAYRVAERLRVQIAGMPIMGDAGGAKPVHVTVSIGVAVLDASRRDLTELLAAADGALYRAKQAGRNQVHLVTGTDTVAGHDTLSGADHSRPSMPERHRLH